MQSGLKQSPLLAPHILIYCGLLFAGCSDGNRAGDSGAPPLPTATTLGEQSLMTNAGYLATEPYVTASQELGDRLLMQCRACHTLTEGGGHLLGPNLYSVFGRRAGTATGFNYTLALQQADFIWTPRALDAWLAQPQQFLPGNAMAYAGLLYADDRAALIASLLRHTGNATTNATTQDLHDRK